MTDPKQTDEGMFQDAGKWLKRQFNRKPSVTPKGVYNPRRRSGAPNAAIKKDPTNAGLWIQHYLKKQKEFPDEWTAEDAKKLSQFQQQQQNQFGNNITNPKDPVDGNRSASASIIHQWAQLHPTQRAVYNAQLGKSSGWKRLSQMQSILKKHAIDQGKAATQGQDWVQQQNQMAQLGPGNLPVQPSSNDQMGQPTASPTQYSDYTAARNPVKSPPKNLKMAPISPPVVPPSPVPTPAPLKMARPTPLPPQPKPSAQPAMAPLRMAKPGPAPVPSIPTPPTPNPTASLKKISRPAGRPVKRPTSTTMKTTATAGRPLKRPAPKKLTVTKESISREELIGMLKEIVSDELGEQCGGGYVHDKDMAKDPKHIKGERWRVKFQSAEDLDKHGNTEMSPVKKEQNENITKGELAFILREVVSEVWSEINESDLNYQPKPKTPREILKLIYSLKEGEGIWFCYDKHGAGESEWIEKRAEGDEIVYRRGADIKYSDHLETERDIAKEAIIIARNTYLNYYVIQPIQGYKKQPYEGDPDHDIGDYELNGPDRIEPQFEAGSGTPQQPKKPT